MANGENRATHVTRGSVLDDLGFDPAEVLEMKVKAQLYRAILKDIRQKQYSARQLETILGEQQPRVSELMTGKLSLLSLQRLLRYAAKLGASEAELRLRLPKHRAA